MKILPNDKRGLIEASIGKRDRVIYLLKMLT